MWYLLIFPAGTATVFLLTTGPVVSDPAFANVYLPVSVCLSYHPSNPKNGVNAKCLELQVKSLEITDDILGKT